MEPELIRRLYALNKNQLILLLATLTEQNTTLATNIHSLLDASTSVATGAINFPFSLDELVSHRLPEPNLLPQDLPTYRQKISNYQARLTQGESQQIILEELILFMQGIELLAKQDRYLDALAMYELIFDTRLSLTDAVLINIFDHAIDEFLPELDLLLVEASSLMIIETPLTLLQENEQLVQQTDGNEILDDETLDDETTAVETQTTLDQEITFPRIVPNNNPSARHDSSPDNKYTNNTINKQPVLTPQLSTPLRQQWLQRLFQFWLLRLDTHTIDEQILNIIQEAMWSEDVPFLRQITINAITSAPANEHANIVDFSHQSRLRSLERFLREISLVEK